MKKNHTPSDATRAKGEPASPVKSPLWLFGLLLVLLAAGSSLMMTLDHFSVMGLPGCGVGSGCAKAAASVWGKVPYFNLPTSSVGLAYFLAVAIGWIAARGTASPAFKWIVRLGVVISLGFLAVIAIEKHFCPYCLIAHGANLAFWIVVENSAAARNRTLPSLATFCTAFAIGIVVLAVSESRYRQLLATKADRDLDETTQRIIDEGGGKAAAESLAVHAPPGGFTGRWRIGPENAPIRIVIFSDYQCKDCKAFEGQVRALVAQRNDVSVSAKHFPLCSDCNKYVGVNMHRNACWAARAAETAGLLRGNDGFWQMHHWLFDRGGSFTDAELDAALAQMGYDLRQFTSLMMSQPTLALVQNDVEEGYALGLFFTPLVFINGVELRGFIHDSTALRRAVERIAAANPPAGSPLQDKPPLAPGKAVGDWREGYVRTLPAKSRDWSFGPPDAPVKVWVWGDYQSAITAELDASIRAAMARQNNIQYIYRHYPLDQSCNPNVPSTISPRGCWAARIAEAAGHLGGNDAYERMHNWLLANQSSFTEEALRQAAPSLGLDADALIAQANSPAVQSVLGQEVLMGKGMIVQGVPAVYVNGKWVARWKLDAINVLDLILQEAGRNQAASNN